MAITDRGDNAGMAKACEVIADKAKEISGTFSKKIPPTIRFFVRAGIGYVNAGGPGGRTAPNAYMFETPGARHPLFGNKRHWYDQPYRPFLEDAAEEAGQDACDKYADVAIPIWAKESGFKL